MKTILVVDDEPVIRELAVLSLARPEWQINVAPDAEAALTAIERAPPDLIFLDLGLPGMPGADLARRLRASEATAGIPIVILSGSPPEDAAIADGLVSKPFTPQRLAAAAHAFLPRA